MRAVAGLATTMGPCGAPRALLLACCCLGMLLSASAAVPELIYTEKPVVGRILSNETRCYNFSLDADTTREVVYWKDAKLYARLEPISGTPHMRASVYGCPSDGNLVNWEYQSDKARNDLRAKGQKVPADWEWPGDLESLSIDVTHRNIFIEVSQYLQPLRTTASLYDLEARLRAKNMLDEADEILDIYSTNRLTTGTEAQKQVVVDKLRKYQRTLMPEGRYILTATLHDASAVPTELVYPMTNKVGWDRTIGHLAGADITVGEGMSKDAVVDPASTGAYLIAFWPPSRANASNSSSSSSSNASSASSTNSSSAPATTPSPAVSAARRLLASMPEGAQLTWGDISVHLEEMVDVHDAARRALSSDDVIHHGIVQQLALGGVGADIAISGVEVAGSESQAMGSEWDQSATSTEHRRSQEEARERAVKETEAALEALRAHVPDFEQRRSEGDAALRDAERRSMLAAGGAVTVRRQAGVASVQSMKGVVDRAKTPIRDQDLEFMIFWKEVTATFVERWGTMTDPMGKTYTRLMDNPCGDRNMMCGYKQWIPKSEFLKLDKNQDGVMSREEYEKQYTASRLAYDDGFKTGGSFGSIAGNGSTITEAQWIEHFDGTQAIIDATVKDPMYQTFWTVGSVNTTGKRIVPGGNASKEEERAMWEPWTQFDQMAGDGRLTRSISGLDDSNNNIYIINVLVRHKVTGEYAAYKPHILQKKTPLYKAHQMSSTDYDVIIGVCSGFGAIVLVLVFALIFTRNKRLRPNLKIKRANSPGGGKSSSGGTRRKSGGSPPGTRAGSVVGSMVSA